MTIFDTNKKAEEVVMTLEKLRNKDKGEALARFFKTGKGEYSEGDVFWGISVPEQRKVMKSFIGIGLGEVSELLKNEVHEVRLTAVLILVATFKSKKISSAEKKAVVKFYLDNLDGINNWDLVDCSAPQILGEFLVDQSDRGILYEFAKSKNIWRRRIAILATWAFIKRREFFDALEIAKILVSDPHDLIQKAVGWMLREVGKKDLKVEVEFLEKYYHKMPRTMLRYAIEKFSEEMRVDFLKRPVKK